MKPLLFLGLLAAVGSAGLAFMVRTSLKETRLQKDELNRKTLVIHNTVVNTNNPAITALYDQHTETHKNAKNEEISAKTEKAEAKSAQDQTAEVKKKTDDILAEKQQIQAEINRLIGGQGTPEEIATNIETLKKENDAKVQEIEQVGKELEIAKKAADENDQQLALLRKVQEARTKAISLSSRTGTVGAVNAELGFAVVNFGKNQGVTTDSRLLVKRGTQFIGKLRVAQVNANQTVADIVSGSVTRGFAIQPGDEVVFENNN
ncbi:MAG: hypothetical protein JWM59_4259 [Verrucomicrobiales bacterium]|nr:hypothetical protein [Verrucomicrobiales bacterium]